MSEGLNQPSVGIVILNWNRKDDTLKCLESVYKLKYPRYEVVVVDNGSTDGSLGAIRTAYQQTVCIRSEKNLGFSAGNNIGIKFLLDRGHKYILLLNDDSTVKEDLLERFVSYAERDAEVAALGAKVLRMREDSKTWGTYGRVTYGATFAVNYGVNEDSGKYTTPKEVDWVIGCGMFLRASTIKEIGLLDEALFSFHEDIDWCIRARKKGYKVAFLPHAIVWHLGSQSWGGSEMTPTKIYLIWYNDLYLVKKHGTKSQKLKFLVCFGTLSPLWAIKRIFKGESRLVTGYVQALSDFLLRKPNRMWRLRGGLEDAGKVNFNDVKVYLPGGKTVCGF